MCAAISDGMRPMQSRDKYPCYVDGKHCEKRYPACQDKCPEMAAAKKETLYKGNTEPVGDAAEKNAANASVILEDCTVRLMGTTGSYDISTQKKEVRCVIGESVLCFKFDDLLSLIDELKGVGRCIKHFDIGNAMW